jgi:hypothetical protein
VLLIIIDSIITLAVATLGAFLISRVARGMQIKELTTALRSFKKVVSKRLARIEPALEILLNNDDIILDSQVQMTKCIRSRACNGELDDIEVAISKAKDEKRKYLSGKALSQPDPEEEEA